MPGLYLVSGDHAPYSPEQLHELAAQLGRHAANEFKPPLPPITQQQVRTAFRLLADPLALQKSALAVRWSHLSWETRATPVSELLTGAIIALETAGAPPPDLRGKVLRLRYLEFVPLPKILEYVAVSERHMFRLQAAGIAWITAYLNTAAADHGRKTAVFL